MAPKKPKTPAKADSPEGTKVDGRSARGSITAEKSALFLIALENGFSITDAQAQAGFSDDAYRRKLKKSAVFSKLVELAKQKLGFMARSKLASAIAAGDMATVRWYLERKFPEEFRPSFGDGDSVPGLPPGTVIVLPGSYPHPRINPEKPNAKDE